MFKNANYKHFLIHLGLAIALFLLLSYIFFYVWLPSSTRHGEILAVPDFNGKPLEEAATIAEKSSLKLHIFDSSYAPQYAAHSVISQFPKFGEYVKSNRTIYLSISIKTPPKVKMPKLVGNSQKSAEITLKSYGLILGNVSYGYGANEGEVLKQLIATSSVLPGTFVEKNTVIDLVVSAGLSTEEIAVPDLAGMDVASAKSLLKEQGLDFGAIVYEENSGSSEGTIWKQKPVASANIRVGEVVDIWVSGPSPDKE